jgi:hypothetical protein
VHLEPFVIEDRVPRWRWAVGDIIVDRQLAMHRDRPAVAVVHRVVRAPGTVGVEVAALYTWRDGHGERYGNGPPSMERVDSGFRFEEAYRVSGPGFRPGGVWYRGARYRREAERGWATGRTCGSPGRSRPASRQVRRSG